MRVLSPDACGATRRHQRIHACVECHGARVVKRPQGTRAFAILRMNTQYLCAQSAQQHLSEGLFMYYL